MQLNTCPVQSSARIGKKSEYKPEEIEWTEANKFKLRQNSQKQIASFEKLRMAQSKAHVFSSNIWVMCGLRNGRSQTCDTKVDPLFTIANTKKAKAPMFLPFLSNGHHFRLQLSFAIPWSNVWMLPHDMLNNNHDHHHHHDKKDKTNPNQLNPMAAWMRFV